MKHLHVVVVAALFAVACSSTAQKVGAGSNNPTGSAASNDEGSGSAAPLGATSLAGNWQVTSISDGKGGLTATIGDKKPTLGFNQDKVFGNAGCNQFGSTVTQTANTVTWSAIAITEMACADRAVMDQEGAYMRALNVSTMFKIVDGKLEFRNQEGVVTLTLVNVP